MRYIYPLLIILVSSITLYSNNVQITNVELTGQNPANNTYQIRFDISWQNSWRTSTFESNWDAVWIFVKYKLPLATAWQHASLSSTGSVTPAGGTLEFASSIGVMLYRDTEGIGDITFDDVELRWIYSFDDDQQVEISVMAIEMVYIPQGGFQVGDNSANPMGNLGQGNTGIPFDLTSEAALTLGGTSTSNLGNVNNLNFPPDDFNSSTTQTLPAAFPKGFDDFYIMKYELSQEQYVEFLNKITENGAVARFPDMQASGNGVDNSGSPPMTYVTNRPNAPMNFLEWADLAAYADWSGLRPMTELEYEKACRGTVPAVPDECAWGNPYLSTAAYIYLSVGSASEYISNPTPNSGNAIYSATDLGNNEVRRCGIVSGSFVSPSRQEAGATYYGVMEMSGNAWEMAITIGHPEGRQFTGLHGNGIINTAGNATVGTSWPDLVTALGSGLRGGSYASTANRIGTSNRDLSVYDIGTRFPDVSGRLVRNF